MRNKVIYFFSLLMPYSFRKRCSNFYKLVSMQVYRNYMIRRCKHCETDIRLNEPLSLTGLEYVSIGRNFKLGHRGIIEAWDKHNGVEFRPNIVIGNNVSFGNYCHIGCVNEIIIEDNVLTGANVLVIDHSHGESSFNDLQIAPNLRKLYSAGAVHIKKNVWLGDKVTVLPGVTIGENCIIGANSVVTKDIPDNTVACGCPAKVVKHLGE